MTDLTVEWEPPIRDAAKMMVIQKHYNTIRIPLGISTCTVCGGETLA